MGRAKFDQVNFESGDLCGEYHDASMCTFDGRDYVVASIKLKKHSQFGPFLNVDGMNTREEAEIWIRSELTKRTGLPVKRVF